MPGQKLQPNLKRGFCPGDDNWTNVASNGTSALHFHRASKYVSVNVYFYSTGTPGSLVCLVDFVVLVVVIAVVSDTVVVVVVAAAAVAAVAVVAAVVVFATVVFMLLIIFVVVVVFVVVSL